MYESWFDSSFFDTKGRDAGVEGICKSRTRVAYSMQKTGEKKFAGKRPGLAGDNGLEQLA
jgi:hypothetical protein